MKTVAFCCLTSVVINTQYTAVIIQSAAHYPRLLFIVKAMGVVFSSADIYNNVSTRKKHITPYHQIHMPIDTMYTNI